MIGIFDSGLGGLTALKEIRALLPDEDYVYFGDTGRVPYGTRTPETIIRYAKQDVRFLLTFRPKAILAACGTVSSTAMAELTSEFDIPIIGVVESTARAAADATKNGRIGIIGTSATIKSGSYAKVLRSINPALAFTEVACPLFVPLVENGFTAPGDEIARLTCERYLAPVKDAGCDTLILGCTHYPILATHIAAALPGVTLISSGAQSAAALKNSLAEKGLTGGGSGSVSYYVSDNADGFAEQARVFLGEEIKQSVEKVDIAKY